MNAPLRTGAAKPTLLPNTFQYEKYIKYSTINIDVKTSNVPTQDVKLPQAKGVVVADVRPSKASMNDAESTDTQNPDNVDGGGA
ncbi:hypothetical protein AMTR_s00044p00130430 [Amborella trichopoda]|uniref:Uncharacterized protein n=1 Tax=Amborella trichopoda TaxID=13333 RepID=U5D3Y6_AMBTC|nr:hypothetical protein AMTR_s00044p00130430 [Amborella trichopoda]